MKTVRLEQPGQVAIVDAETPKPAPGEALVRLRLGGLCGSDLAAYRGTSPLVNYPTVIGHELVVDVLDVVESPDAARLDGQSSVMKAPSAARLDGQSSVMKAPGAARLDGQSTVKKAPGAARLKGQRAVVEPMLSCGTCRACQLGRYNCCTDLKVMGVHVDGGLRETMVVPVNRLHPVDASIPDDVAVMAEPLSIAYHAVSRAALPAGQTAVVLGAGTIGLLITMLLQRARGCRVIVVDRDETRLAIARQIGATTVQSRDRPEVSPGYGREPGRAFSHESDAHDSNAEIIATVRDATKGAMADVVFEVTGHPACTRLTTELVAHAGRIVLIGWNAGPTPIDTVTLMRKEVDLLGSRNSRHAFPAVLQLLEDKIIDPELFITHRFPLTDTAKALRMLDVGDEPALKVVIEP